MVAPPPQRLDPESLVARIIDELQENPEAQALLLRALLTNEFLGMPARLERVEADVAEMKLDIAVLKTDVAGLKTDVAGLKTDVAVLKGDSLEAKLHRRARPFLSQKFNLRRTQIVHSPLQETTRDLFLPVEGALDSGLISAAQEARIDATDIILRAQRQDDRSTVWVAMEVSNEIGQNDIERVHESAEALRAVFHQDVMAVVTGYSIRSEDEDRAGKANVHVLLVSESG